MRPLRFRKSSYSGQEQNCVEVAHVLPDFHTSSYSSDRVNCVEVAPLPTGAALRDSKHPDRGHLIFPTHEWVSFLTAARTGEL